MDAIMEELQVSRTPLVATRPVLLSNCAIRGNSYSPESMSCSGMGGWRKKMSSCSPSTACVKTYPRTCRCATATSPHMPLRRWLSACCQRFAVTTTRAAYCSPQSSLGLRMRFCGCLVQCAAAYIQRLLSMVSHLSDAVRTFRLQFSPHVVAVSRGITSLAEAFRGVRSCVGMDALAPRQLCDCDAVLSLWGAKFRRCRWL